MEYFITAVLALFFSFSVMKIIQKRQEKIYKRTLFRQSDMHDLLKTFFSRIAVDEEKPSQLRKRIDKDMIKVVIVDSKAYWISENIFYVSDAVGERPDPSTARPVDTTNMSKNELDKMMFILDNLNRGKRNDDSSAGNK